MIESVLDKLIKEGKVVFNIKVKAGTGKTQIVDVMKDGVIKITVKAIPEKGKANSEIIKYLSKVFKTEKENIKILSGAKNSKKLIKIIKNKYGK
jgi:uncharacterized protein (TIGR00251 family)